MDSWIQIHGIFHTGDGVVDEVAIASAEVEDGSRAREPLAEEGCERLDPLQFRPV
jgi:hypothetical protein